MRSRIILPILLIAVMVSMVYAQEERKIGVVNSSEVLQRSEEGKKVLAQLEQKRNENQDKLEALDKEIRQLQSKLNTQRLSLSPEAIMQLKSDIEEKQIKRQRMAEDLNRELNEMSQRLFQQLQSELLPIIEEIGKEKNLDIVFDLGQSGIIYFQPTLNITQEVIERYNARQQEK